MQFSLLFSNRVLNWISGFRFYMLLLLHFFWGGGGVCKKDVFDVTRQALHDDYLSGNKCMFSCFFSGVPILVPENQENK